MADTEKTGAFITRWSKASGSERANCQLFVTELCALLGLPQPDPASNDTCDNAYVFERRVTFGNSEHRDAVLARYGVEPMRVAAGQRVQRWDGKTFKLHPATGEQAPDETAWVPQWR